MGKYSVSSFQRDQNRAGHCFRLCPLNTEHGSLPLFRLRPGLASARALRYNAGVSARVKRATAVALTVAGSDSGGGAGIQADLKTFRACGVFGTSAITCVTAQNPDIVSHVESIAPGVVVAQIDRVLEAFTVGAAKTGMLYSAAIIEAVADRFANNKFHPLVVDPVMIATSGAALLQPDAVHVLRTRLLPLAAVVTPNIAEAEALAQHRITSRPALREAAQFLADRFGVPFLVKGGHLPVAGTVVDVLYDGHELHEFRARHRPQAKPHGAGCTFSAALTAQLALGQDLVTASRRAQQFVQRALAHPLRLGRHQALGI